MNNTLNNIRIIALIVCFSWLPSIPAAALAEDMVHAVAYEYPPDYSKPRLAGKGLPEQGHGFVIDVVEAAFNAVDVKLAVTYQPMARSTQSIKTGQFVAQIGSRNVLLVSVPEEEIESIQLGHYYIFFHYFKSRFPVDTVTYTQLTDLNQYIIASLIGTPTVRILKKEKLQVDEGPKLDSGLHKLVSGRADLWTAVGSTALFLLDKHYPELRDDFTHAEKPLFGGTIDINFKKSHKEFPLRKAQFERGIDIIYKNGTYMKILESYFGKGRVPDFILSSEYKRRTAAKTCSDQQ